MIQNRTYKERPELSEDYSAIDGIEKLARDFRETDSGTIYKPAERPIRSDIEEILSMSKNEFIRWYAERKFAIKELLGNYKLFASVPHLSYGSEERKYDMKAYTHIKDHLDYLEKGLDFLEKINERYFEICQE